MKPEVFQYSPYKIAPQKPSLDIKSGGVVNKEIPRYVLEREMRKRAFLEATQKESKTLDGLRRERKALLHSLKEKTVEESFWIFVRKSQIHLRRAKRKVTQLFPEVGPKRMVYGSLMGGVVFGIVTMGLLTQYLGGGVFADEKKPAEEAPAKAATVVIDDYNPDQDVFFEYFSQAADEEYEKNIREMVKGYPIEEMVPYILTKDRLTAAFLIGIAKKESNWGKRVPVLNGQDCYNYWGYRGIRRMMGTGGHTCFNSREDAVDTVAKRLDRLIHSEQLNTPEKLVVWKCGFSCEGHSRESVKKWISDVDMYYSKFLEEAPEE
jgi:hypothetical protein